MVDREGESVGMKDQFFEASRQFIVGVLPAFVLGD